jgi:hypothetical protein
VDLPPPAVQIAAQLLDLAAAAFGEHADRAHTDHDLADWTDVVGNFDSTSREAAVQRPSLTGLAAVSRRPSR